MRDLRRWAWVGALVPLVLAGEPAAHRGLWYDTGHRIVARLAELRLTAHTREAVRAILGGQSLADASVWADNITQYRPETKPLHYVDIPVFDSAYRPARDCPTGRCIIVAIDSERQLLADPATPPEARAEAVRFLIHFMADLHQPLHVANNNDRGGNEVPVVLNGESMNLHQAWDGEIIKRFGLRESDYFDQLRAKMDSLNLVAIERGSVVDWALEGHRVAGGFVYRRLPPDGQLGEAYVDESRPIIDHALIAAGVRLAKVLNDALVDYRPTAADTVSLGAGIYSDRAAAAHLGETATVVGTIASVFRSDKGTVYLNFGADYPRQTFTAVALAPAPAWTARLDTLVGRRVAVRGRITSYKGRLEIVLESADQLAPAAAVDTSP